MQSVGELPGLLPVVGSPHGRPSTAGLNLPETPDVEDGGTNPSVLLDGSSNKNILPVVSSNNSLITFI